MAMIAAHFGLAALLFWLVNWIGEHATDFGYASMTLFEEPNDSLAFNFFIRALAPAVFTIALSAAAVAAGHANLRIGIYMVAVYYYAFRAIYVFVMNLQRLISWPRYFFHSIVGLAATWLAYQSLILPNRSLLPNLDAAGNELWLAIFAFLYAAANKITSPSGPGNRRRNAFIQSRYVIIDRKYGETINNIATEEQLKLIVYAIIIYEDYCRPPFIRWLERVSFWRGERTTGIMQVASAKPLTNEGSVDLGARKLLASWQAHKKEKAFQRVYSTIVEYNKDDNYRDKVFDVMRTLAVRAAPQFKSAYDAIFK